MGTYCSLSGLSGDDIIEFVSIVNRSLEKADAELGRRHRNYQNCRESMPDMDRYITDSEHADEGFALVCCVPFVNGALLVAAYTYFEDSITRICAGYAT